MSKYGKPLKILSYCSTYYRCCLRILLHKNFSQKSQKYKTYPEDGYISRDMTLMKYSKTISFVYVCRSAGRSYITVFIVGLFYYLYYLRG